MPYRSYRPASTKDTLIPGNNNGQSNYQSVMTSLPPATASRVLPPRYPPAQLNQLAILRVKQELSTPPDISTDTGFPTRDVAMSTLHLVADPAIPIAGPTVPLIPRPLPTPDGGRIGQWFSRADFHTALVLGFLYALSQIPQVVHIIVQCFPAGFGSMEDADGKLTARGATASALVIVTAYLAWCAIRGPISFIP